MNGMPDAPVQVPIDHPDADTEWNDILRKHKIIPEKPPSPTKELEEAYFEAQAYADEHKLDHATLDELDELEDFEDEEILESIRRIRMAEMQQHKKGPHGRVYPMTKAEWEREVTEASEKWSVLVLLTGPGTASKMLEEVWPKLAEKWMDVKFCQMTATLCFGKNYPDKHCPTVVVYSKGDLLRQAVGLEQLGGRAVGVKWLSNWMAQIGAVEGSDTRLNDDDGEDEEDRREAWRQKPESNEDFDLDLD